jgi:hypothetical protein
MMNQAAAWEESCLAGYAAFKAVFIPHTHYIAPAPDVDKVAHLMSALRAAVGPKVEIRSISMVGLRAPPPRWPISTLFDPIVRKDKCRAEGRRLRMRRKGRGTRCDRSVAR